MKTPQPTTPPAAIAAPPEDEAVRLRAVIGRLARRLRPTAAAAAAGLTPTRVTILLDVVRRGPVGLSEVAASEGINPTMLSRVVSELVADGLLERGCDPRDRRAGWVKATATGRRLAERMRRERTAAVDAALEALSPDQRAAVADALPGLEALAERLGEAAR